MRTHKWIAGLATALCLTAWPTCHLAAKASENDIQRLILELGHDDYFVRERAQQALAAMSFEAFDALCEAKLSDDPEIAARASYLVRNMSVDWTMPDDPPFVRALMGRYGDAGDDLRAAMIRQLTRMPDRDGLEVLCRICRFERSQLLSKLAARFLIEEHWIEADQATARAAAMESAVQSCQRPAANWLRAYVAEVRDAAAAKSVWEELARRETEVLVQKPAASDAALVGFLWRRFVEACLAVGDSAGAQRGIAMVLELEPGASESLVELIGWMEAGKNFAALDEVEAKFAETLESDAVSAHRLAMAREAQGRPDLAEPLWRRAVELAPGNEMYHRSVMIALSKNCMTSALERELTYQASHVNREVARAEFHQRLAELLHDRGDEAGAVKAMQHWIDFLDEYQPQLRMNPNVDEDLLERAKSRARYFKSGAHELAGDRAARLEELLAGLNDESPDIEVLIALFNTPELQPDDREKTMQLIDERVESFRDKIRDAPDVALNYNQLAWLIGNTQGDYRQAIEYSRKSLELTLGVPQLDDYDDITNQWVNVAGYVDTLARCHYAAGELEQAVAYQTRAIQLDPGSGQMKRQLKMFQDASQQKRPQ